MQLVSKYSARRLFGSRIVESAAYYNHILLVQLYLNSKQNTLVNWIILLLLPLLCCWSKVILWNGRYCTWTYMYRILFQSPLSSNTFKVTRASTFSYITTICPSTTYQRPSRTNCIWWPIFSRSKIISFTWFPLTLPLYVILWLSHFAIRPKYAIHFLLTKLATRLFNLNIHFTFCRLKCLHCHSTLIDFIVELKSEQLRSISKVAFETKSILHLQIQRQRWTRIPPSLEGFESFEYLDEADLLRDDQGDTKPWTESASSEFRKLSLIWSNISLEVWTSGKCNKIKTFLWY